MTISAAPTLHAVIVAPTGLTGALRALADRLANSAIAVSDVDEIAEAVDTVSHHAGRCALLLDCRQFNSDDPQDQLEAADLVKRCRTLLPMQRPIVIAGGATNTFIVAMFRAGAGDLIDLAIEGTTQAKAVVTRACSEADGRIAERDNAAGLRALVGDFLRELIVTERQKIDIEAKLNGVHGRARPPRVLVIEPDATVAQRLSHTLVQKGVETQVFAAGEDAMHGLLAGQAQPADLVLVDLSLPGMDGIETIAQLRAADTAAPCLLMATEAQRTRVRDNPEGVAGFVIKPFENLDALTNKLLNLAAEAQQKGQEQRYLREIKTRHAALLERFRSLST